MNAMVRFVVERSGLAWGIVLLASLATGFLAGEEVRNEREAERLERLQTEAERRGIEIMSQTLNGNVMGAIGLLGMIAPELKREALGELPQNNAKTVDLLENVARSFDAAGLFLVNDQAIIGSAWYSSGKPSTGRNVQFRAYYQMAMQGISNVYAAVGTGSNERILYYGAPIFSGSTNGTDVIGTLVARVDMHLIDNLLRDKADIALLLSPQGVVFASSRTEWIGHMAGKATPEQLKAIRDIKQFGDLFVNKEPPPLPIAIDTGIHLLDQKRFAVASAKVQWNDPLGDWTLVMLEDLGRTVSPKEWRGIGIGIALTALLIALLLLKGLQGHYRQRQANQQLERYARQQEESATGKAHLATAALHMQQSNRLATLTETFLRECHKIFGILQGVAYVRQSVTDPTLRLVASYACTDALPLLLQPGEGLLGQCAIEKRMQVIETVPEGFGTIRSGLGETRPTALLLAPVVRNDVLLGVIEVALLSRPDDAMREAFESLIGLLAMNIEIVEDRAVDPLPDLLPNDRPDRADAGQSGIGTTFSSEKKA